jgi:hypothetical protein
MSEITGAVRLYRAAYSGLMVSTMVLSGITLQGAVGALCPTRSWRQAFVFP